MYVCMYVYRETHYYIDMHVSMYISVYVGRHVLLYISVCMHDICVCINVWMDIERGMHLHRIHILSFKQVIHK